MAPIVPPPLKHQWPQPPQPQTVWATAVVGVKVPKPRGQKPEDEEQFIPPSRQAPGGIHDPQTNPTHNTTIEYLNTLLFALHCISHQSIVAGTPTIWSLVLLIFLLIFTYFCYLKYLLYIALLLCVCWGTKHTNLPLGLDNKNVIKVILILIRVSRCRENWSRLICTKICHTYTHASKQRVCLCVHSVYLLVCIFIQCWRN